MRTVVSIPGMHCKSCETLIRDVSTQMPDITNIDVNLGMKRVTLEHTAHFDFARWTSEVQGLDARYAVVMTA